MPFNYQRLNQHVTILPKEMVYVFATLSVHFHNKQIKALAFCEGFVMKSINPINLGLFHFLKLCIGYILTTCIGL